MPKNYTNDSQTSEIVKYISDTMKFPIMGAGGGFAPIGTEAYFDGQVAPLGWVICDGAELNIADYPDLATYYASQHGASNYYGGDGITTFAVPVRNGMPTSGVDSPDEHIVGEVRKTIDGVKKCKPVYEKVVDFGALPSNTTKNVQHGIDDVEDFVRIQCMMAHTNGYSTELIISDSSVSNQTTVGADKTKCYIGTKSTSFTVYSAKFTLRYTKTTDDWQTVQEGHSADGNGIFCVKATVSGDANAHQYSTEEQVVGKWIDGSPVYEKTISIVSTVPNTTTNFPNQSLLNNMNIEHIIGATMFCYKSGRDAFAPVQFSNESGTWKWRSVETFGEGTNVITLKYTKTQ